MPVYSLNLHIQTKENAQQLCIKIVGLFFVLMPLSSLPVKHCHYTADLPTIELVPLELSLALDALQSVE